METLFKPVVDWQQQVLPPSHERATERVEVVLGEVNELIGAVLGRNEADVLEEATDVLISTAGFMKAVNPEVDLNKVVGDKISVMMNKYPANRLVAMQKEGVPFNKAMSVLKAEWQAEHPEKSTGFIPTATDRPGNVIDLKPNQSVTINNDSKGMPDNITKIRKQLEAEVQKKRETKAKAA